MPTCPTCGWPVDDAALDRLHRDAFVYRIDAPECTNCLCTRLLNETRVDRDPGSEGGVSVLDDVRSIAIVHSHRPAPPPTWKLLHGGDPSVCECHATDGAHWMHLREGLSVIESVAVEEDGRVWHHVSAARRNRNPSYDDLALVRRQFIGEDREAYMILPPASRHINIHSHALHLFACLDVPDGRVLPRMERGGTTI